MLDDDPGTSWTTERYEGGAFPTGKSGVGLYLDAKPGVIAKQLDIRTNTTGWAGKIYVSNSVDASAQDLSGWRDIGATFTADKKKLSIPLDTAGQKFRYYLIWITKLPPSGQASIAEVVLLS